MSRYALIQGGRVAMVVEQAAPPATGGAWIDCTAQPSVGAGYTYNAGTGQFASPQPPAPHLTTLEFLRRLTMAEEAAIDIASIDDPAGTPEERMQQATLRAAMRRLMAAEYVDMADAELIGLLAMLESVGLLAAGRAAEIIEGS